MIIARIPVVIVSDLPGPDRHEAARIVIAGSDNSWNEKPSGPRTWAFVCRSLSSTKSRGSDAKWRLNRSSAQLRN